MPVTCQVGQRRASGRSGPSRHSPPFPLQRSMPTQGQWSSTLVCVCGGVALHPLRQRRCSGRLSSCGSDARRPRRSHRGSAALRPRSSLHHRCVTHVSGSASCCDRRRHESDACNSNGHDGHGQSQRDHRRPSPSLPCDCHVGWSLAVWSAVQWCGRSECSVERMERRGGGTARDADAGGNARRCGAMGGCSLRPRRRFERGRCFCRGNCQPSGEKRGEK